MLKKSNAQFSLEFVSLIAFMFFIFLGFIAIITTQTLDAKENKRQKIAEDIAQLVMNEIELAVTVSSGYNRTFELPAKIEGNGYGIQIIDNNELVVNYLDKEFVVFLPENVVGNVGLGINEIRKIGSTVYLSNVEPPVECNDGIDNDGDSFIDLADAGCINAGWPDETNCGDNICEGDELWPSCGDCSPPKLLLIKGAEDAISFDEVGNVALKGTLQENELNPPLTGDDEFIFKDGSGDVVAVINMVTGNMFISGNKFENQIPPPSPISDDLIIKNSDGEIISYIDELGDFYLKGVLTENS